MFDRNCRYLNFTPVSKFLPTFGYYPKTATNEPLNLELCVNASWYVPYRLWRLGGMWVESCLIPIFLTQVMCADTYYVCCSITVH